MDETRMTVHLGPMAADAVERAAALYGMTPRSWVRVAISDALIKDLGSEWFSEGTNLEKRSQVMHLRRLDGKPAVNWCEQPGGWTVYPDGADCTECLDRHQGFEAESQPGPKPCSSNCRKVTWSSYCPCQGWCW